MDANGELLNIGGQVCLLYVVNVYNNKYVIFLKKKLRGFTKRSNIINFEDHFNQLCGE